MEYECHTFLQDTLPGLPIVLHLFHQAYDALSYTPQGMVSNTLCSDYEL